MAFPTTGVLDVFTGTNGADLPTYSSTNWSAVTAVANMEIQSNSATGTAAAACANTWNTAFNDDQECYVTIATKAATGNAAGCGCRFDNSAINGYLVINDVSSGTDSLVIVRVDGGAGTAIRVVSQEFTAGDGIGIEALGTSLQAQYKAGAGAWATSGAAIVDATYASGDLIIYGEDTTCRLDSFGGGSYVAAGNRPVKMAGRWGGYAGTSGGFAG